MLKYVEDCLPEFFIKADNDLIKTRILCYANCYGLDKSFVDFWCGDGVVISRFDSTFTVWADDTADFSELKDFLIVIGATEIVTFVRIAERLDYEDFTVKRSFEFIGKADSCDSVISINDDYIKEAYQLISSSISGSFKDDENSYLSFLSDFKYRKNRGLARGYCINDNNTLKAVGFTAAETNDSAILSGIACHQDYRSFGYGRKIVESLLSDLQKEGKNIFVIALNDSASGFYLHIGFEEKESIAYIY